MPKKSQVSKAGAKNRADKRNRTKTTVNQDDMVFKALANSDRRAILDLIRDQPLTTGDICSELDYLDRCTVMLHLRLLGEANLIISKKRGRFRWNYLNVEPVQRIYQRWIKDYAQPATRFLSQLKRQLEAE